MLTLRCSRTPTPNVERLAADEVDWFAPGHRLRIDVSSSNFPRFDRNLNTGGNNWSESVGVVALNRVHHSAQYPSAMTVTVVRRPRQ